MTICCILSDKVDYIQKHFNWSNPKGVQSIENPNCFFFFCRDGLIINDHNNLIFFQLNDDDGTFLISMVLLHV